MSVVLAQVCRGYAQKAGGKPVPLPLTFIAAPVVLHGPTRRALPRQARSKLGPWLDDHPVLRAGFPRRARSISGAVQAGIRDGLRTGLLALSESGLSAEQPQLSAAGVVLSDEVDEILSRSAFVGGWLALAGHPTAIYALWRVRP